MNELKIIARDGKFVADSREVADMVGKQHNNLLRDIDGYVQILSKSDLSSTDFFIEATYQSRLRTLGNTWNGPIRID